MSQIFVNKILLLENKLKSVHKDLIEAKNKPPEEKIVEKLIQVQDETIIKYLENQNVFPYK